jgi:hypothetical protein
VITITDLFSAQDSSLNADLSEAEATFAFLIDLADTLRVSNSLLKSMAGMSSPAKRLSLAALRTTAR